MVDGYIHITNISVLQRSHIRDTMTNNLNKFFLNFKMFFLCVNLSSQIFSITDSKLDSWGFEPVVCSSANSPIKYSVPDLRFVFINALLWCLSFISITFYRNFKSTIDWHDVKKKFRKYFSTLLLVHFPFYWNFFLNDSLIKQKIYIVKSGLELF